MKRNVKKGFTLVELVVVIAVLAIIAGTMTGAYYGVRSTAYQNNNIVETNDIANKLFSFASDNKEFQYIGSESQNKFIPITFDTKNRQIVIYEQKPSLQLLQTYVNTATGTSDIYKVDTLENNSNEIIEFQNEEMSEVFLYVAVEQTRFTISNLAYISKGYESKYLSYFSYKYGDHGEVVNYIEGDYKKIE